MSNVETSTNSSSALNTSTSDNLLFPSELMELQYFGFCKEGNVGGRLTKIPCTAKGYSRSQAADLVKFADLGPLPDGYGYAFSLGGNILHPDTKEIIKTIPGPDILILDYDDVLDVKTGQFTDDAKKNGIDSEIYQLAQAGYVEISKSGTGFHAICRKPEWMSGDDYQTVVSGKGKKKGNPEIFCGDKYVWLTGNRILDDNNHLIPSDFPLLKTIVDRQMKDYTSDKKEAVISPICTSTDEKQNALLIANCIRKISDLDLYKGEYDTAQYESPSEAALGLCNKILCYVDSVRELDVVFKSSPFFKKHYSTGWNNSKERHTYAKAFAGKKERESEAAAGTTSQTPVSVTVVDELPENTYKKNALRIDLSIYPDGHLLKRYVEYVMQRTDSYPEYSYASFLYLISVLTQGKAVFKQRYSRKTHRCILWMFCLGYSTISRKSTAIDNAEGLLKDVLQMGHPIPIPERYPHSASRPGSPEGFAQDLQEHPVSFLIMDEAGELLTKMQSQTMQSIRDDFCIIYDGKDYTKRLSKNQKKDKSEWEIHVDRPFFNMLMCTTFDNFSAYTSRLDLTSGWLLRVLYTAPEYRKDKKVHTWTDKQLDAEYDALLGVLLKILRKFNLSDDEEIMFTLQPEAQTMIVEWSDRMQEMYAAEYNELKLAYFGRVELYVQKLAILHHIMTSDFYEAGNTTVSAEEMQTAIRLCEQYHIPTFLQIESTVGKEKNNLQDRIIEVIKRKGGRCSKSQLIRSIHRNTKALKPEIESLIESKEIKAYQDRTGTTYYDILEEGDT